MWSWPLLGEASTMLPGICAASPISTPKWGQIGPTSSSKAWRKGIRLGLIFHDSGPLRKLVDFQAKLINFGEGLGPRAPRAPPRANFRRFWPLQKSGRVPRETREFLGGSPSSQARARIFPEKNNPLFPFTRQNSHMGFTDPGSQT